MKKFQNLSKIALCGMVGSMLFSCSKDEPADKNLDSAGDAVIEVDGTYLTRIGNISIEYDKKGRPVYFSSRYGDDVSIDYSKGKIYIDDEEGDIAFTKDGYISYIKFSESEKYDGASYSAGTTYNLSYNGQYLSKVSVEGYEKGSYGGEKYSEKWTETQSFTWSGDDLMKIKSNGRYEDEDGVESYNEEFEIEYSSVLNKFRQMPYSIPYFIDFAEPTVACVGLMGKGPKHLPSSIIGDDDWLDISFELNDNKSIDSEQLGEGYYSDVIYYSYENIKDVVGNTGYDRYNAKGLSEPARKPSMKQSLLKRRHHKVRK